MKVFCIGFQKTGTTSMEAALAQLDYNVDSVYGRDLSYEELRERYVDIGLERARRFDAVQDMPWPLLYRDLDAGFPDAKFVLTVRDEDAWWSSILGHFGPRGAVMQKLTYGPDAAAPLGHERRYRRIYREHNAAVRDYFAHRPGKLLELDFSAPVDWPQICDFLGAAPPETPFPASNQPTQAPNLRRDVRRKAMTALNWAARPFEKDAPAQPSDGVARRGDAS